MPYVFKEPHPPQSWKAYRKKHRSNILVPYLWIEWIGKWAAWFLGRSVLLELLEYCGTLSILVGVIFYFAGARDRLEQKHYQAWQVINTAQGKGGSGGRIDALQDLNNDGVALTGVDLRDAFLRNVKLPGASLDRASLGGADMRGADLSDSNLKEANLVYANLEGADLRNARCPDANLKDADFSGANLGGADFLRVDFTAADLRDTDLEGISNWESITSMSLANIHGCKHAPEKFREWALAHGAVEIESDSEWNAKVDAMDTTRPTK
jgi:uncharacterized protein YjbI with pentapeptide repeats